jgi:nitrile hydratase subunit alpha
MDTTRRGFLAAAATAAGATATPDFVHAEEHDHQVVPSDLALRTKSLESLLVEKGLVDPAALDAVIDAYEHKVGPRNGARVVARAWVDAAYKQRLLADGRSALAELGYGGTQGDDTLVVGIQHECTTSSSAPCAPVILGPSSVCRRSGTSLRPIARAR